MDFDNNISLKRALNMIFFQLESQNPRTHGESTLAVPFLLSKPGAGKTEMLTQLTKDKGWAYLTTHLSTQTIEELTGLPTLKDGIDAEGVAFKGTEWTKPDVVTRLEELARTNKGVVWFMDDFHLASPENQKFCFQLFTDYELKGYKVPKNVHIVLAGNPGIKAGAKTALSAITNRVAFYPVKSDVDDWCEWALTSGVERTVVSFLGKKQYAGKHFHEEEDNKGPWASPRSWVKLAMVIDQLKAQYGNNADDLIAYTAQGHVGAESALAFTGYWNVFSKVNTSEIFDQGKLKTYHDTNTNDYIWSMAVTHEYIHRFLAYTDSKEKKKKDRLTEIMSKLIEKVADRDRDTTVLMFKTIADAAKISKMFEMIEVPFDHIESRDERVYEDVVSMIAILKGK